MSTTPDPTGLPLPTREGAEVEFERTIPAMPERLATITRHRVRALDVLFEADARRRDELEVLADRIQRTAAQTPLPERARELVRLHASHAEEIDEKLAAHSPDWPLHRMPAVDRAILRLGAAEVLFDTPAEQRPAVIGEYIKIAETLSTDSSPRFINGLLSRLTQIQDLLG